MVTYCHFCDKKLIDNEGEFCSIECQMDYEADIADDMKYHHMVDEELLG